MPSLEVDLGPSDLAGHKLSQEKCGLPETSGHTFGPGNNLEFFCRQGHTEVVYRVAFSSEEGTRVATASGDKTVRIWDVASGACTSTLEVMARER